ncbi:hypothetical protein [Rivularia sp. PCC 7116]|uniref:hypothetical protein n=1 Tax=Rivularia sp. PCC 7116 TaxID=373994 RepID=UPI0005C7BDD2|nr:hypothetical protein [Rivularia sp. PCC 7116]
MKVSNDFAVNALIHLLRINDDNHVWCFATENLEKSGISDSSAIAAITEIIHNCQDDYYKRKLTALLNKII